MMTSTLQNHPREGAALDAALAHLVESGELSQVQAQHVHEGFETEFATRAGVVAPAEAVPHAEGWTAKLIEVGAYLGAALVAAGGAIVVGQQWHHLGRSGQLGLLLGLTLAFGVAGAAIAELRRRRAGMADDAVLRRLASTLLTFAAAAVAGLVAVWFIPQRGELADARAGWMFLIMGLAAGAITVVARLVAPSAIAEAGLYAAVLALPTGLTFLFGVPSTPTLALIGFFALGAVWAALALTTRMLTVPTLGAVLGLLTALMTALGDTAVSKWLALALAVGGFAAYVKLPRWPLVAAAMLGAVVLTFEVVGSATNGAVALLVAGLLLLVLATLGFFFGRRRGHAS